MNGQNNKNNNINNGTKGNLEAKILRENINKNKKNDNNLSKTPRRYNPSNPNPANDGINHNENINNNSLTNKNNFDNKNSQDFNNKNESSFDNKNIQNFDNKNIDSFDNKNIQDFNNRNISDLNNNLKEQNNENLLNNNQLLNNNNYIEDYPQTLPSNRRKNNLNNNNNDNSTIDPTQRRLNRLNNQKKQQEGLKNDNENNNTQLDNKQENNKDKNTNNSNNNNNNPTQNKPKTKGSAPKTNNNNNNNKQSTTKDNKQSNIMNNLGKLNQMKNNVDDLIDQGENAQDAVKEVAKEEAKKVVKKKIKEKIMGFLISIILPILPYIGVVLLIIFVLLLAIFMVIGVFDDEDNVVNTIKLNYCEYVNLKWGEEIDQNKTITSSEYIKYKINNSDFKIIDNKVALKALIIVYRTNLYANSDNLDSNVCYLDVEEEYEEISNELLDEAMEETDNKVFSVSPITLSEIAIDKKFTYSKIDGSDYRLYQDKMSYDKGWVDSKIGSSNISSDESGVDKKSYSPFASWYLAEENNYDYLSLIFHFVTPGYYKGNIYKVIKISPGDPKYGDYNDLCSDISLTSTSLERQEFIDRVNSGSSSSIFKTNAGKIYDIATNNNFNPEMVVIRAELEGFSPGGSTNNYWGIGCTNSGGAKACKTYPSFDVGVLGYIETVKKINSVSLFQMQYKYTYIGSNWFNPGSSSAGGCYYFPYIKKYMSESRVSEVDSACASGASCSGSSCLKTTDEDQTAYTRWQIEKSLEKRTSIFGITADNCSESDDTVDDDNISDLGKAVANYAVKTFDNYQYSQGNRHQDGYVDCSSMVSRAYRHFNIRIYDSSDTSGEIYRWCEKNGKTISGSNLAPGDLIFYNSGSHRSSSNYQAIGHVEMYIGNGQKFGAHKHYSSNPSADVSVKTYTNDGNLFCRPTK